jgi:hypothetical protein
MNGVPTAYISGLLSNGDTLDEGERKRNAVKAFRVARKYMKLGYAVVCPHLFSFPEDYTEADRLNHCLKFIRKLDKKKDVVVMSKNWSESAGATAEHREAWTCGVPTKYEDRSIYTELNNEMSRDGSNVIR